MNETTFLFFGCANTHFSKKIAYDFSRIQLIVLNAVVNLFETIKKIRTIPASIKFSKPKMKTIKQGVEYS